MTTPSPADPANGVRPDPTPNTPASTTAPTGDPGVTPEAASQPTPVAPEGPGASVVPPTDMQHAIIREVHEKILELSNWLVGRLERGPEVEAALIKLSEVRTVLHDTVLNAAPLTNPINAHLLITANPNYPKVDNSRADGDQAAALAPSTPNPPVNTVPTSDVGDPAAPFNDPTSSPESSDVNPNIGKPWGAGETVAPIPPGGLAPSPESQAGSGQVGQADNVETGSPSPQGKQAPAEPNVPGAPEPSEE